MDPKIYLHVVRTFWITICRGSDLWWDCRTGDADIKGGHGVQDQNWWFVYMKDFGMRNMGVKHVTKIRGRGRGIWFDWFLMMLWWFLMWIWIQIMLKWFQVFVVVFLCKLWCMIIICILLWNFWSSEDKSELFILRYPCWWYRDQHWFICRWT